MARKSKVSTQDASVFDTPARAIKDVDIVDEIETMFVPFAQYSIADRAIPSVLDGLKPSQRRILWAMQYAGFTSKKPYVKSARIAAETIGNWNPHGDAAAYATMANMVKPYIMNVPLVDGKGSFGFVAGDTESASRYTEARMDPIADMFMEDIKYDAVDMRPNFDERLMEPVNLPVIFPVLPVNGATGIAVGFATNCAPHNPGEIIDATIALITNPKMTVEDLIKIVPGPDFPTGCDIIGTDGIRDAYLTGKGKIKERAKYRIINESRGRHVIEFYEIPYNISPERVIDDINKLRNAGSVQGITDVMNLMDKSNPVRIAVYIKSGIDAKALAELLIDNSPSLYCTFAINQTALLNDAPHVFPMTNMLQEFIDFRRQVITRRTKTQIKSCEHDKSLQEGLAIALLDIDKVIAIVRASNTNIQVYTNLKKTFDLDDEQAKYIGDMRLIQLKRKDKLEVDKKIKGYEAELKRLRSIIKNQSNLDKELIKELLDAKQLIDRPRKSHVIKKTIEEFDRMNGESKEQLSADANNASPISDIMVSGTTSVFLSGNGEVSQSKKRPTNTIQAIHDIDLNDIVLVIRTDGSSIRVPAYELPEKPTMLSKATAGIVRLGKSDKPTGYVAMSTNDGHVKVLDISTLTKQDCDVISLAPNAKVTSAVPLTDDLDFIFITTDAKLLHFNAKTVNPQGRTSKGVVGIKLSNGAQVLFAGASVPEAMVITATESSSKMTPLTEYPAKGRGTGGVRCHKFLKGEKALTFAAAAKNIIAVSSEGEVLEIPVGKRDGSGTTNDLVAAYIVSEYVSVPKADVVLNDTKKISARESGVPKKSKVKSTSVQASNRQNKKLKTEQTCNVLRNMNGQIWRSDKYDPKNQPAIQRIPDALINGMIMLIFDNGNSVRMPVSELPDAPMFIHDNKCMGIIDMENQPERICITLSSGKVKVLDTSTLTKVPECPVIKVTAGDTVLWACEENPGEDFVIITDDAKLLRFSSESVRAQGRTGGGVDGIKLAPDAHVLCATAVIPNKAIVITGVMAGGKRTPLTEFPPKGRATGGVRCQTFLKGEKALDAAWCAPNLVGVGANGHDVNPVDAKRDASGKRMVSAIRGWLITE